MTVDNTYKRPISSDLAVTPIAKFMTRKVVYAMEGSSIHVAMQMMITHKVSGLPIVDAQGTCMGIYSEMDAMLQAASQPLTAKIKFTKPPITVSSVTPFRDVLIMMVQKKIKRIPVLDGIGKLMGVVSRGDLMKALYKDSEQNVQPQKK
jgi:CBS domain-containing protein